MNDAWQCFRRYIGGYWYTLRRYLQWQLSRNEYAHNVNREHLPHTLFQHRSYILRPLKDVDMYLQYNKATNLALAIQSINGISIHPEETFSLWKLVGKPTAKRGFLEGLVLQNGRLGKGIGGGLCQLGNLLYWIILHSPLVITERYRHGYDVFPDINRTIPFGCGATLSYNYIDFQFKNTTPHIYQLKLWVADDYLQGELLSDTKQYQSYEVFETNHSITSYGSHYVRHNQIWRWVTDEQTREKRQEFITENHAIMMYNPLLPAQMTIHSGPQ